jgi:hypothetical protein
LESLSSAIPCFAFFLAYWKQTGLITRYNSVKQGSIIIHKLNKLLISLQSESLLFVGPTVRNKPRADLPFSEIFHQETANCFSPISSSSSINRRVIGRSVEISSRAVSTVSGVRMAVGRPLRSSSSRFSRPSGNLASHSKARVRERALSPLACFISWKVSVAVIPVLKQNLMFALCSITTNCHHDLHCTKYSTRLSMSDL